MEKVYFENVKKYTFLAGITCEIDETVVVRRKYERSRLPAKNKSGYSVALKGVRIMNNAF